ncbi:MAG: hypothetical protein ACQERU_05695, partial [Bacteroidota bacterium]
MNILTRINQFKYPKEFRILPMNMSLEELKQLEGLINELTKIESPSDIPPVVQETNKEFLAEISVGAWRLKKKMIDIKTGEPLNEMSKAYRHLESVFITLENEGIEIQDHDG